MDYGCGKAGTLGHMRGGALVFVHQLPSTVLLYTAFVAARLSDCFCKEKSAAPLDRFLCL